MKHPQAISRLEDIIRPRFKGSIIEIEKEYDLLDEDVHGEIDCGVYDLYNRTAYLFEVKSRNKQSGRQKAIYQTHKDVKYTIQEYAPQVILFKRYYVYGLDNKIRIEHLGGKK